METWLEMSDKDDRSIDYGDIVDFFERIVLDRKKKHTKIKVGKQTN
jgi:hypothetical protein